MNAATLRIRLLGTAMCLLAIAVAVAAAPATAAAIGGARPVGPNPLIGQPTADFTSRINYAACRSCHWIGASTKVGFYRHSHMAGSNCVKCHDGWPARGEDFRPWVRTNVGFFTTAGYTGVSAARMHAIHVNGSWPTSGPENASTCAGCHGRAACDTCHKQSVKHTTHAYTQRARSAGAEYAYGTRVGAPWSTKLVRTSLSCVSAGCHGQTIENPRPACATCHGERIKGAPGDDGGPIAPTR